MGLFFHQTVNLETDAKTLYYSLLKLKYSPFIYLKHKKDKRKQEPQKSHEKDILPKNLQFDRSLFASYGTHAGNYFGTVPWNHTAVTQNDFSIMFMRVCIQWDFIYHEGKTQANGSKISSERWLFL